LVEKVTAALEQLDDAGSHLGLIGKKRHLSRLLG
jgi:hypothetical protein